MTEREPVPRPVATARDAATVDELSVRILARTEAIRRRELETAYGRLEAADAPVEPHVRAALAGLTRSLVEELYAGVYRELEAPNPTTVEHERLADLLGLAEGSAEPRDRSGPTPAAGDLRAADLASE